MALNKEVWLNTIMENFFADDSFAVRSVDDSAFVTNHTVHVPNAGEPSGVVINRAKGTAAAVSQRTDSDLTYDIDELTTNPIYIPNIDIVELSYDKRASVLNNDRTQLQQTACQNLLYNWFAEGNVIETTGDARAAHTSTTATGTRKAMTKADVLTIATKFNQDNVPMNDRVLLLDAVMYADLMNSLTNNDYLAFSASANVQTGVLGKLYGFDIMMRSQVLKTTAAKKLLKYESNNAATECACGLAWQKDCVSRALGEAKMFESTDDPTMYGDIYSFLLREGGAIRRSDSKGVAPIVEITAA